MIWNMLCVFIGGGVGAVSRYGVSAFALRIFGAAFPWGTLIVNLAGCVMIGMAYTLAEEHIGIGARERLFFITGFLGGLTTFSSYGWESVSALNNGAYWVAAANIVSNNIAGLAMVLTGIFAIKCLLR